MKTGTLYLVTSKNPPVFDTPMRILYRRGPQVGESFLFAYRPFSQCNLSETKRLIRLIFGVVIIKTRNSWYVLRED